MFTDPKASPSGYPFKVAAVTGTLSEEVVYARRRRVCDGFLRTAYKKPDGSLGYRCPSEPAADYLRKGGTLEETVGRKCLCNGLLATVGHAQRRAGGVEPPIVTCGDDVVGVVRALGAGTGGCSASRAPSDPSTPTTMRSIENSFLMNCGRVCPGALCGDPVAGR